MNKKKHIQTNFFRFLLEKYSNDNKPQPEIGFDDEVENPDDDETNEELPKRLKRMVEIDDEDPERTEDDDIIDELVKEYKKIKKHYENRRIPVRRKR